MTVNKQDTPKVIALVGLLVIVMGIIGIQLRNAFGGDRGPAATPKGPVANLDVTSRVNPVDSTDPMAYVRTIEQYSAPPPNPVGNPFRTVLPQNSPGSGTTASSSTSRPGPMPGGDRPVPPWDIGAPGVQVGDFPEIKVEGVLIDYSSGPNSTYAVVVVNNKMLYLKEGDKLRDDVKILDISEAGIWVLAGKEKAFIEVSRSYKPSGMPNS